MDANCEYVWNNDSVLSKSAQGGAAEAVGERVPATQETGLVGAAAPTHHLSRP